MIWAFPAQKPKLIIYISHHVDVHWVFLGSVHFCRSSSIWSSRAVKPLYVYNTLTGSMWPQIFNWHSWSSTRVQQTNQTCVKKHQYKPGMLKVISITKTHKIYYKNLFRMSVDCVATARFISHWWYIWQVKISSYHNWLSKYRPKCAISCMSQ